MRLDHLLSREILLLRKRNEETLSPQGLGFWVWFWGAVGYRDNQAYLGLFGSLTFKGVGLLGFFGLVVCFLESGCECLCDAFDVRILFVDRLFLGGWCFFVYWFVFCF